MKAVNILLREYLYVIPVLMDTIRIHKEQIAVSHVQLVITVAVKSYPLTHVLLDITLLIKQWTVFPVRMDIIRTRQHKQNAFSAPQAMSALIKLHLHLYVMLARIQKRVRCSALGVLRDIIRTRPGSLRVCSAQQVITVQI